MNSENAKKREVFFALVEDLDKRADFLTSLGEDGSSEARAIRMERCLALKKSKQYANFVSYIEKHKLFVGKELASQVCSVCVDWAEIEPWNAIGVADRYGFTDLAKRIAYRYIKDILRSPNHDKETALDLCLRYARDDEELLRSAVHAVFKQKVRNIQYHTGLLNFINKYPNFFSPEEVSVAKHLKSESDSRLDLLDQR